MSAYSFLISDAAFDAGDDVLARYPRLQRSRHKRHQLSLLTLGVAAGLALAAAVVVAAVSISFEEPSLGELGRRYGHQMCARGHSTYQIPINNFASCCTHYSATCCDLSGSTCSSMYQFALAFTPASTDGSDSMRDGCSDGSECPESRNVGTNAAAGSSSGGPRVSAADRTNHHNDDEGEGGKAHRASAMLSPRCLSLLSLLACGRCSPFAGHFISRDTPLSHRPNMTICYSFCDSLWRACAAPGDHTLSGVAAPQGDGVMSDNSSTARQFCERIGLRVQMPSSDATEHGAKRALLGTADDVAAHAAPVEGESSNKGMAPEHVACFSAARRSASATGRHAARLLSMVAGLILLASGGHQCNRRTT